MNQDIRDTFADLRTAGMYAANGTLELIGSSFLVTDDTIFGTVNDEYIERELEWYMSESLSVYDFPGGPPKIWKDVADRAGMINSNYGFLMYSPENGDQFRAVLAALKNTPNGRQATAVYTRPGIHRDWSRNGMADFICTNAVNYFLRNDAIHAVVQMRSNDAIFGFRNDYAWQCYVLDSLAERLEIESGMITWQAASLHIYPRHFHMVDTYLETGDPYMSTVKSS